MRAQKRLRRFKAMFQLELTIAILCFRSRSVAGSGKRINALTKQSPLWIVNTVE